MATGDADQDAGVIDISPGDEIPNVKKISVADVEAALREGLLDFRAMPTHTIFFVALYIAIGALLIVFTFNYNLSALAFPLIGGFALLGPLTGLGIYELSRRRERGEDTHWRFMFSVLRSPSIGQIVILAGALLVAFFIWIEVAQGIYTTTMGDAPESFGAFINALFTTAGGWALIIIGNATGAVFALVVFAISAVSFPMLIDRKVDALTAIETSVRAVARNPKPMGLWALVIGVSMFAACIPAFLGLAVVLPVLGHSTWHMYRRVIGR
ncbi:MAG: DUF2189 domain-containing protein [Geminicoccaceae bacterium]